MPPNEPLLAVTHLLTQRKETIATAESCTGGRLASLLTDIAGSSAYFERGVVTYSNRSKTELLQIPESLIQTFGAVSPEVAVAMAKGVRRLAGTTYGVGITGIAGPDGGTLLKPAGPVPPVGTVYVAVDSKAGTEAKEFCFATGREAFKRDVSQQALILLQKKIAG
ncbi:MAG: CinA family protein [bacterium]|nr:CinA family protein [bacterium]